MTVDLAKKIRDVPDFPKPGIVFKDIMPLLADPEALRSAVDQIAEWAEPRKPDLVLGAEARGYITGGALACRLGCGFVAARKPGKLPWRGKISSTGMREWPVPNRCTKPPAAIELAQIAAAWPIGSSCVARSRSRSACAASR